MNWQAIERHAKDPKPFWMGTSSGGVMMEAWHWCSDRKDFAGLFSETTLTELRAKAPGVKFFWAEMQAPKKEAA